MSARIATAEWTACHDCIHSDDGDPCGKPSLAVAARFDWIVCEDHQTARQQQEHAIELDSDADRDES